MVTARKQMEVFEKIKNGRKGEGGKPTVSPLGYNLTYDSFLNLALLLSFYFKFFNIIHMYNEDD
jgi:hypothetical protein